MKKFRKIITLLMIFGITACSDWLDILPQNSQPVDKYWNSKEDVESVVGAGYVKLRDCIEKFIMWGELRGGVIYGNNTNSNYLQTFRVNPTHTTICNWGPLYEVINMANSVLEYASGVYEQDDTYTLGAMNSHLTEAYFLRALSYFYLTRNWRDAPLVLETYATDELGYNIPKSTADQLLTQIKLDIETALNLGAAREYYDQVWETKGRSTKWSLYALMADVSIWTDDYDTTINYCDSILNSTASNRPVFVEDGEVWFEMFYPGNSNESIFELQYDRAYGQTNKLSTTLFGRSSPTYIIDPDYFEMLYNDNISAPNQVSNRGVYKTYVTDENTVDPLDETAYIWKYNGSGYNQLDALRPYDDANYIIYRVAEIMLIKAEALVMKGESYWIEAIELVNKIRTRAGVPTYDAEISELSELELLEIVLNERLYELTGEGKRWYDLLRMGKRNNYQYKNTLLVEPITRVWSGSTANWIRSVLSNNDALYLPIWIGEMNTNNLLEQNPYYE